MKKNEKKVLIAVAIIIIACLCCVGITFFPAINGIQNF
jgi:hypothetical protein